MTHPRDLGDERLNSLLDDAVSDVDPPPALDLIRARTKAAPMSPKRPWTYALVAAVATAATVAAVVVLLDRGTDPVAGPANGGTTSSSPTPDTPTSSGTTAPATTTKTLPVYYLGDTPTGPRLYREFHRLEVGASEAEQVSAAVLRALTASTALDPDYRSPWPQPVTTTAEVRGEEVWIDLSGEDLRTRPPSLSADEAAMAVEQVIHTAHAVLQRRSPVQLTIAGERTDQVLGVPASEPLAAGDPMQVQASVWITSPQEGDTVAGTFTVEGRGAFFEANVSWQLFGWDGDAGDLVDEGFTTAEEGMTLSPYSFTVEGVASGDYLLRVYDADMSGGEGPGEQQDTKVVTVR